MADISIAGNEEDDELANRESLMNALEVDSAEYPQLCNPFRNIKTIYTDLVNKEWTEAI